MKLVLAGGYDTQNLGDHAMLQVLRQELRDRGVEPEITLLSRHPDAAFDRAYGVRSIRNLDHASRDAARGKVFAGLNGEADPAALLALTRAIAEADALLVGGGRMLVDYTHGFLRGHLSYFALLVTIARCHGTPIVVWGQSLEELATESGREHLAMIFRNADAANVREEGSLEVLHRLDPRLVDGGVEVIPDPAFGLREVDPYHGPKMPRLSGDRPVLALNVRSYAWRDDDVATFETALAAWLDELRAERELDLLFVPQMTYDVDSIETDDRAVARRIAARLSDARGVFFVDEPLTVDESLGIYRRVGALLSMRRHGVLFAATQGTPVLPLSCEANTDYMSDALGLGEWRIEPAGMASGDATRRALALLADPLPAGRALRERCRAQGRQVGAYAEAVLTVARRTERPEGLLA